MNKLTYLIIYIFTQGILVAQQTGPILVQYGNTVLSCPTLNTAISQAPSGATIYLPGGDVPYVGTQIIINKPLNIIGTGISIDSTNATNFSKLGNITLLLSNGCDNSRFEGFSIKKIRTTQSSSTLNIHNIVMSRIRFNKKVELETPNYSGGLHDFVIYNCILDSGLYIQLTYNFTISNNIIMYHSEVQQNGLNMNVKIFNNLFLGTFQIPSWYSYNWNSSYDIRNNIFATNILNTYYYSNLKNNCFNGGMILDTYSSGSNNYLNTPPQNVLTSYTPPFTFSNDYHVINGSVGDNGGDDGTDIGIYGGLYPWKDGLVPQNPHIRDAIVSPQSNSQGEINIHFKVGAQEH